MTLWDTIEAPAPPAGKVQCAICGKWFGSVGPHVKVHGMTAKQYRIEHPSSSCTSPLVHSHHSATKEHRELIGRTTRKCWNNLEHRRKRLAAMSVAMLKSYREGRHIISSNAGRGICGDFYLAKNKQTLHYRSQLELHWYQLLETLEKVKQYQVEPVIIPYEWKGVIHNYFPDLWIEYTDGTMGLTEIKPEYQWEDPQNLAKWAAARKWCAHQQKPMTFRVAGYKELAG